MPTNRKGRTILRNPGGKFYVMDGSKKLYQIDKNIEASNHPDMFTADQLRAECRDRGIVGYSKLKKDELWAVLFTRARPKAPSPRRNYVYTDKNRFKTFAQLIVGA
jgi:hypothetical protein